MISEAVLVNSTGQVFAQFESTYPLAVILGEGPIETIESDEMLEKDEPIKAAAV